MNYEDRIVCFIDILGFKEHVKESNSNRSKVKEIADALLAVRRVLDIDSPNEIDRDRANITQFSDSIVISFKCNEKSGVFYTLLKLLWVQGTLVNHGMLVRGAIVRGDFIHDNKLLFGQGIIDAYEAETKAAVYPRIILGNDVLHIALNYAKHNPVEEAEYLSKLITQDTDGIYYIDYFGEGIQNEFNDPEFEYIDYLKNIRDIIDNNIGAKSIGIKTKYGWLKSKHNQNINRISDGLEKLGISSIDLKSKHK